MGVYREMWKELLLNLTKDNPYVKLNPPATDKDILEVDENALQTKTKISIILCYN